MFTCRNCTAHESRPLYTDVRDRFHGHAGRFAYVECAGCGLTQIEEIPENLGEFYASYRVHGGDSKLYHRLRQLTIGHSYLTRPGGGKILLDFGCGNGWYLKEMAARGWQAVGFEPDVVYAASLAEKIGLEIISGDAALTSNEGRFDLITLNFAFEHLDQPRRTLQQLTRCLKPGGEIYLSVPNIESREARLFKDLWFHLDPPRHISFFTKGLLQGLLKECGFSDIEVKDLPLPTGLAGSVSYRLWNRFQPLTWYALIVPGMVFSALAPDGNFAISGRRLP
jgi:SAM-dependent methyltransferase